MIEIILEDWPEKEKGAVRPRVSRESFEKCVDLLVYWSKKSERGMSERFVSDILRYLFSENNIEVERRKKNERR